MTHKFLSSLLAVLVSIVSSESAHSFNYGTNGNRCEFFTLSDAIERAAPGATIFVKETPAENGRRIVGGHVVSSDLTLQNADANCRPLPTSTQRVWLNGGAVQGMRLISVAPGVSLTLQGIRLSGGYARTGDGAAEASGGTVFLERGAQLSMLGSKLEGGAADDRGGCLAGSFNTTVSMLDGSEITGCTAGVDGGGLDILGGALTIGPNSSVHDNRAEQNGGNIYFSRTGTVLLSGRVYNGSAGGVGGGLGFHAFVGNEARLIVSDSAEIFGNIAGVLGGGVFVLGLDDETLEDGFSTVLTIDDQSRIFQNAADAAGNVLVETKGGGIYAQTARVELNAGSVIGSVVESIGAENTALFGGGVYLDNARLIMRDVTRIGHNSASALGGGVYAENSDVQVTESALISSNSANRLGGGMFAVNSFLNLSENSVIGGNRAGSNGAGLYLANSEISLSGAASIEFNNANSNGGGIYAEQSDVLIRDAGQLYQNSADAEGGGAYLDQSTFRLQDSSKVAENNAEEKGGGIRAENNSAVTLVGLDLKTQVLVTQNSVGANVIIGGPPKAGGGISIEDSSVETVFAEISENTVGNHAGRGGGIAADGNSVVDLVNTQVNSNSAAQGGGLNVTGSLSVRSDFQSCRLPDFVGVRQFCSEISNNGALRIDPFDGDPEPGLGGGIVFGTDVEAKISATLFFGNVASDAGTNPGRGGAIAQTSRSNVDVAISDVIFDQNRAQPNGTVFAVDLESGSASVLNSSFVRNDLAIRFGSDVEGNFTNNYVREAVAPSVSLHVDIKGDCNLFGGIVSDPMHDANNILLDHIIVSADPLHVPEDGIDACETGSPLDILGTPRPMERGFDIGSIEETR